MTKTHFLCLANSKKYGERCIAGIALKPGSHGHFHAVIDKGKPKWVRPVSSAGHGQVPADWVEGIAVGHIVEFAALRPCPSGYQTENVFFEKKSIRSVRPAMLSLTHFEHLAETMEKGLFGNTGRSLGEDEISAVGRSLILVRANKAKICFSTPWKARPRMKFRHEGTWYDLPMTDVNFYAQIQEDPDALNKCPDVFLTVSLGACFEGKYYKLAAGLVFPEKGRGG